MDAIHAIVIFALSPMVLLGTHPQLNIYVGFQLLWLRTSRTSIFDAILGSFFVREVTQHAGTKVANCVMVIYIP